MVGDHWIRKSALVLICPEPAESQRLRPSVTGGGGRLTSACLMAMRKCVCRGSWVMAVIKDVSRGGQGCRRQTLWHFDRYEAFVPPWGAKAFEWKTHCYDFFAVPSAQQLTTKEKVKPLLDYGHLGFFLAKQNNDVLWGASLSHPYPVYPLFSSYTCFSCVIFHCHLWSPTFPRPLPFYHPIHLRVETELLGRLWVQTHSARSKVLTFSTGNNKVGLYHYPQCSNLTLLEMPGTVKLRRTLL